MRRDVLRSTLDFYQFLISFCDKIVGAELLHHVGSKKKSVNRSQGMLDRFVD